MRNQILWVGLAFVAFLMGLLYYFTDAEGEINRHDLACFFTIFVMLQFWNSFNAKAFATGKSAFNGLLHDTGFVTVALFDQSIGQFFIVTNRRRCIPYSCSPMARLVTNYRLYIISLMDRRNFPFIREKEEIRSQ